MALLKSDLPEGVREYYIHQQIKSTGPQWIVDDHFFVQGPSTIGIIEELPPNSSFTTFKLCQEPYATENERGLVECDPSHITEVRVVALFSKFNAEKIAKMLKRAAEMKR